MTPAEITRVANNLVAYYQGANSLANLYAAYVWDNQGVQQAWPLRCQLQSNLLASNFGLQELQAIHMWGFNGSACTALNQYPALLAAVQTCLHAFALGAPQGQLEYCLTGVLTLQKAFNARIGLARLSKWICFVDQDQFAIADSRTSRGLYPIDLAPLLRAFPVLPGRAQGASDGYWQAARTARMYLDYVGVMRQASAIVGMKPAQVEMALFMAGQAPLQRPLRPLRPNAWY